MVIERPEVCGIEMATWRAVGAIAMVASGVAVAAAGPDSLVVAALALVRYLDVVLLVLAVVVFASLTAPKGTLKAPFILAVIGLAILSARFGFWTARSVWMVVGLCLALFGAWIILTYSRTHRDWTDPVQRLTVVLRSQELKVPPARPPPRHLTVTAVGATARVDLLQSAWPAKAPAIEIAINCLAGRVELSVPTGWAVVAGRVHQTWGIHFKDHLDRTEPVRFYGDALAHFKDDTRVPLVIIHVVGMAGLVRLPGRDGGQLPLPPPSSS